MKSTRWHDRDTQGIREVSHSSQTDAFSWNGWTKCEQVYTEQIKLDKKEKGYQQLVKCPPSFLIHCLPQ